MVVFLDLLNALPFTGSLKEASIHHLSSRSDCTTQDTHFNAEDRSQLAIFQVHVQELISSLQYHGYPLTKLSY
jgi:hypothetical protein